ncbi:hypothetical protein IQ07DRAFT_582212 [Pyrenochaeta sp. DS3sAY3a]|nr:hypothetical protein IQ07DRAFT_582212 [Pyrenochaeta sp. DS3sAY3a]
MAEPQPSSVHEGASTPPPPTTDAESRKAAAALDALDTRDDASSTPPKKHIDSSALDAAIAHLSVSEKKKSVDKKKGVEKKVVKVDAADVALLVTELELSKAKATELLREHEGDVVKAMKAFVGVAF